MTQKTAQSHKIDIKQSSAPWSMKVVKVDMTKVLSVKPLKHDVELLYTSPELINYSLWNKT
ncbi:CLUMA_CG018460, isoform A [Clunio marinus]|uniref:CLUMA_CG018460, isoform A n=1 Tax=Clunio marinus TaxID=568069 RepID=A0A1J1J2L8_9DIPT|nr:CLUMA_CG018460, isoform A [Clunio marinus]